jgi:hypothetical protein
MGLFFTLFYIFAAFLGPQILFGDLAQYHIEVIIVLLALVFSMPSLQDSELLSIPQTYGIIGLTIAVVFSIVFNGWLGGGPTVLIAFIPNVIVFFLVLLNCKTKTQLQILISVLLAAILFTIYRGYAAEKAGNVVSLYVITMKNSTGEDFYRIRGVNFLNDPNDLAQVIVGLIPCVFIFWFKGRRFRNLLFVYLPVAALLYGMYLTHSRGGMIALMAAAVVAGRRKLGITRSVVLGVLLFVALSFAGFSGGRDVSAESGADRMEAWGAGLMMIRIHPLFGVGINRFTDFHEITAHNTVVLCAAELGLTGLFFWMLCFVPVIRDTYVASGGAKPKKSDETKIGWGNRSFSPKRGGAIADSEQVATASVPALAAARVSTTFTARTLADPLGLADTMPDAEVHRMASLMLISFAGFLTAGWFLARAYTLSLFLNAGIAAVIYQMARRRGIAPPPIPMLRAAKLAAITGVIAIAVVWISIRLNNL